MPESMTPPPIWREALQMAAAAEVSTIRGLLPYVSADGLEVVRRRLKDRDLLALCSTGGLADLRIDVLDATCRALIKAGRAPAAYYAPDMWSGQIPDFVPDDMSLPDDNGGA